MRYRIVSDGVTYRVEEYARYSFLWWKWVSWEACGCWQVGLYTGGTTCLEKAERGMAHLVREADIEASRHDWRTVKCAVSKDPNIDPDAEWLERMKKETAEFEDKCLAEAEKTLDKMEK